MLFLSFCYFFFFFNDTATTEIYTLSLHDALPISASGAVGRHMRARDLGIAIGDGVPAENNAITDVDGVRSEEHTSELQSLAYLVCRLLLEKKKKKINTLDSKGTNDLTAQQTVCAS